MNKSIFERIFPHPPSSSLPRYEEDYARPPSSASSSNRISLRDSSARSIVSSSPSPSQSRSEIRTQSQSQSTLQSTPLSASIIHHDDPFLPISRAAKSLENTLQSLLDAQSDALEATLPKDGAPDNLSSVGSPTPTPSMTGTPRHEPPPKLIPIRQPKTRKLSLRGARRGLSKTMEEFARLKSEELRVISAESRNREAALQRSKTFSEKKAALQSELEAAQADDARAGAAALRTEAAKVQNEIHELESRLFELRTRHRHLIAQADQHDNTIESKLSSYKHSISTVDRDVRQFLHHPPVPGSLIEYDHSKSTRGGMYALQPDRRTLEMAEEQWTAEQLLLEQRQEAAQKEQLALQQGAALWKSATERLGAFEKYLRQKVRDGACREHETTDADGDVLVKDLDSLIASLHADIEVARSNNWMLLLACLGAEWAALCRARVLLTGEEPREAEAVDSLPDAVSASTDRTEDPPADLLNGSVIRTSTSRRDSTGSNQSLQDTLRQFSDGADAGQAKRPAAMLDEEDEPAAQTAAASEGRYADGSHGLASRVSTSRNQPSDSDDDDPGPEFLVSHT